MDKDKGKKAVLVVDDDPDIVYFVQQALEHAGYRVVTGVAGESLQLARDLRPSVILLDITMPWMDGVKVRQRLREDERTADIPVIALSAAHNLRARAADMAADDYLSKPFDLDELLLRIEKWTGPASSS